MKRIRIGALAAGVIVLFAACSSSGSGTAKTGSSSGASSSSAKTPTNVTVQVGINDPNKTNIAVLQYMPAKITVEAGAPVDFVWDGAIEPHSVTFLPAGQSIDPATSDALFAPTPAKGPIDGTTLVNSGLLPRGPEAVAPMEVTFAKAGTFEFHCVIHPGMNGAVEVVAKGASGVDTPAAVAQRAADDQAKYLAEGQKAEADYTKKAPDSTKNPDGSTTWKLGMGVTTENTDTLEFQTVPAAVKAGDTVTFINESGAPHTASFFNDQPPILDPSDPKADAPSPGPSPQTLASTGYFNTGTLPPDAPPGTGPPEAVRSFSFKVAKAGTYSYVCIFHVASGMAGQINAT
ncbi:MAG: cupredoxin domain-containing protein [Acidimicrobiales bacterium]